jgi:hypothetical protein
MQENINNKWFWLPAFWLITNRNLRHVAISVLLASLQGS